MGKSQETFAKKEKEKKRLKKREDKKKKAAERRANSAGGKLEAMMAYLDEDGNIVDTPPDPTVKKKVIKAENIELGAAKREKIDLTTERKGKIEFFNQDKGYGFIRDLGSQEKFFVHVKGLMQEVKEGDKVTFELEKGLKGMNAVRVKTI